MHVLAIDPGTTESAWVIYDPEKRHIVMSGIDDNEKILKNVIDWAKVAMHNECEFVIEMVASYGMPVGETVFETCLWIGRFIERWGMEYHLIYRKQVCMHLCGKAAGVKDSNIIQRLKDIFEPELKPREKPKKALKGIARDMWQALAVAVTYCEINEKVNCIAHETR